MGQTAPAVSSARKDRVANELMGARWVATRLDARRESWVPERVAECWAPAEEAELPDGLTRWAGELSNGLEG
jgi:hypothetical protein